MLAAVPIIVILLLMMAWRWSAARAGSVGLVVALLVAWFGFGLGTTVMPGDDDPVDNLSGAVYP
jgi:L-lactate permease